MHGVIFEISHSKFILQKFMLYELYIHFYVCLYFVYFLETVSFWNIS